MQCVHIIHVKCYVDWTISGYVKTHDIPDDQGE